ncbi:hypothetical protein RhiJN_16277 [Ceratobasidium sp. AG-Ba]|nr:hypothetical protein RhiJN_16277 [Ceratobasidium sp. AG-Ba]
MMYNTGFFVAAASIVGASAQGLAGGSLSSSCQSAFANILTGPAGACLGVSDLANVAMTPSNESLVPAINTYLTNTCAQPACTNATIDATIANITSGCQSDLSKWNVSDSDIQTVGGYIKEFYPVGRQIACLTDSNDSNKYCITTTLQTFQTNLGAPLSVNNLWNLNYSTFTQNSTFTKNLVCTDCTLAAWNIIKGYLSADTQSSVQSDVDNLCGSGFSSGTTPSNIRQTANSAIQGSSSSGQNSAGRTIFGSLAAVAMGAAGATMLVL